LNLARIDAPVGFEIETLPPAPPVFSLLQELGGVTDEEMFRVFNMGVGFVVVVRAGDADRAARVIESSGHSATRLGRATAEPGRVVIEPAGLAGTLAGGAGRLEAV
ncbi:MAG TPA: AIR synthase-related protein, partial [Actinomycetota bacterium]|nr:AIR synthase-related protein [Actinomycetota bacterium]